MRPIVGHGPMTQSALFGGTGTVQVWDLLGRTPAEPFAAVLACELEPGGVVGRHRQVQFPEIVVCTGGAGMATVDEKERELKPGSVVHLPLGSSLALANASESEPLTYLIIKAEAPSVST